MKIVKEIPYNSKTGLNKNCDSVRVWLNMTLEEFENLKKEIDFKNQQLKEKK